MICPFCLPPYGYIPTAFAKAYPETSFTTIHRDNYLDWIT